MLNEQPVRSVGCQKIDPMRPKKIVNVDLMKQFFDHASLGAQSFFSNGLGYLERIIGQNT